MESEAPHNAEQHGENQQPVLTSTLSLAQHDTKSRTESICEKITELMELGVRRLDELKEVYINRLTGIRRTVEEFEADQTRHWTEKSAATIADEQRLQAIISLASDLVAAMA